VCATFVSAEDYAFVLNRGDGQSVELIEADQAGGGAKIFLTGRAGGGRE